MYQLESVYRPLSGRAWGCREILPCQELRPFVRCFWGNDAPAPLCSDTVIPDTCMDLIFKQDENGISGAFCAMENEARRSPGNGERASVFAVRFYGWAAALFSDEELCGTAYMSFPPERYFKELSRGITDIMEHTADIGLRCALTERLLLSALHNERYSNTLMNALYYMIKNGGAAKIRDISDYAAVSAKRLERVFTRHTGVSPKEFSSLVRFQLLWRDILSGADVFDLVVKFGYTDQPHLLHDFKKYMRATPSDAIRLIYPEYYAKGKRV